VPGPRPPAPLQPSLPSLPSATTRLPLVACSESLKYIAYPRTNEDFIANLGKTNPLDYKFYGICVASCPGASLVTLVLPFPRSAPPSSLIIFAPFPPRDPRSRS
jgi:hypothetical protein